jgi:hypothetical protein
MKKTSLGKDRVLDGILPHRSPRASSVPAPELA